MLIEVILLAIFTLAFSQGIFLLIGVPGIMLRLIMESLIGVLFVTSIYARLADKKKLSLFGILPIAGLFLTCLVSYVFSDESIFSFMIFLKRIFVFYIFFIALLNLELSQTKVSMINRYIIFLFIIQIPANLVKFIIVGQREGCGIGIMSMQAGSLTTTFVLFALAFAFAHFFFKGRKSHLLLVPGFLLFGIIGNKRAIPFYIPLLVITTAYFYTAAFGWKNVLFNKARVSRILVLIILSFAYLCVSPKIIPSLNPQQKAGGTIDIRFLAKYIIRTVNWTADGFDDGEIFAPESKQKLDHPGKITLGRYATTLRSVKHLQQAGPLKMCFGFGAGNLVTSSLLDKGTLRKVTMEKYNIGYGITGFVWYVLQIGLLGIAFLVWFYFELFRRTIKLYKVSPSQNYKAIALSFIGVNFVFFLDFFTYSTSTLMLGVLTPVYFYIAFILIRNLIPSNEENMLNTA